MSDPADPDPDPELDEIERALADRPQTLASVVSTLDAYAGAGLQGNPLVQSLGIELQRGNRIGVGPALARQQPQAVADLGDAEHARRIGERVLRRARIAGA